MVETLLNHTHFNIDVSKTLNINKQILQDLYVKKCMTQKEIANKFGLKSSHIIEYNMKKYNISGRNAIDRMKFGKKKGRPVTFNISKKFLYELYIQKNMTQKEIANKFGLKSSRIIENNMKKYNIPRRTTAKRDQYENKNHMWNGGKTNVNGYIYVLNRNHPRTNGKDKPYIPEHVLIMEKYLGRTLKIYGFNKSKNEVVHHINGNRKDNRLKNLKLMTHGEHIAYHRRGKF